MSLVDSMHLEGWSHSGHRNPLQPRLRVKRREENKQEKTGGRGGEDVWVKEITKTTNQFSGVSDKNISSPRCANYGQGRLYVFQDPIDQAERLEKDEGALYDLWALPVTPTTSPPTPHLLFPALWTLCHSLNSGKVKSVCWQPVWTAVTPAKTLNGHFVMAFDPQTPCGCRRHFLWTQKNLAFRYFC